MSSGLRRTGECVDSFAKLGAGARSRRDACADPPIVLFVPKAQYFVSSARSQSHTPLEDQMASHERRRTTRARSSSPLPSRKLLASHALLMVRWLTFDAPAGSTRPSATSRASPSRLAFTTRPLRRAPAALLPPRTASRPAVQVFRFVRRLDHSRCRVRRSRR